ncbi:FtsQ-type POTRA domain-containing protein, partial [Pseudomonas aeruginosa]
YILPYAYRPIAKVSVAGDLSYIRQRAVQQRISPYLAASFFTIDLAGMRGHLEQMPWTAHAEVRRAWPDQVVLRKAEQLPVERW